MKKIKTGIIGAGSITSKYLEVLKKIKEFEVVAISSRTFSKAFKIANKFEIENVYSNNEDLIKFHNLDAIIILVSYDEIYKVTKKFLKYQIPILVEKPPGLSVKELETLAIISKNYKTLNMVALNRRFYSIFHKAINLIKKNDEILNIVIEGHERFWKIKDKVNKKVRNKWLFVNSIHTIDLIRFFGGEIKNIKLEKKGINEKYDQFYLLIRFKNNNHGIYYSNWYSPGGWSIKLFSKKYTVIFNPLEEGKIIDRKLNEKKIVPNKEDRIFKCGFYSQINFFKKLVLYKKLEWPAQSLIDMRETYKIIDKMHN